MTVLAILIVVGQALVVWLLLRFVRTFGSYTDRLVQTHQANLRIHEEQAAILRELRALRLRQEPPQQEVA